MCDNCTDSTTDRVRWHREVGAILGFPSCCVEAFVSDLINPPPDHRGAAVARGGVNLGPRSEAEKARMRPLLEAITPDGRVVDSILDGTHLYVPCAEHVGVPGWEDW